MPRLIEEDLRYVTPIEFRNYTQEALETRPNLPGYEFSLLLDQLDEEILKHPTHSPAVLVLGTAGLAYWLARHVEEINQTQELLVYRQQPSVKLKIRLDPTYMTRKIKSSLSTFACVVDLQETLDVEPADVCIICPAQPEQVLELYQQVANTPVIAHDPLRKLKPPHFLNSAIWV